MPVFTIVTPVYNAVGYFPEAIASVQAQTFLDWEWLIVDDGSSDGSLELARRLAFTEARVRVLQHPDAANLGQSASRNLAIKYAGGAFYAFLDADDVWIPEKLQRDLACFQRHPRAHMLYSRMMLWYQWRQSKIRDYPGYLGVPCDVVIEPPDLFLHFVRNLFSFRDQYPAPSCLVIRREAKPTDEDLFDPSLGQYEDAVPVTKVLLRYPAVVCDDIRTYHRRGGESFTSGVTPDQHAANFRHIARWIENYLQSPSLVAHRKQALAAFSETKTDAGADSRDGELNHRALNAGDFAQELDALNSARHEARMERALERKRAVLTKLMAVGRTICPAFWRDWMWNAFGRSMWYGKRE